MGSDRYSHRFLKFEDSHRLDMMNEVICLYRIRDILRGTCPLKLEIPRLCEEYGREIMACLRIFFFITISLNFVTYDSSDHMWVFSFVLFLFCLKEYFVCLFFVQSHEYVTRGWFKIKMPSYLCRESHCGDKTILRPSYLYLGISYTGEMTSLYRIRA